MRSRWTALAVVAAAACGSKSEVKGGGSAQDKPPPPTFTLFALAELRGQIGPCGCTSDPLGDISRTTQLVEAARAKGPVLVVDAGSLLYSQTPVPAHLAAQEELKADLLRDIYKDQLHVAAVGLGPADLAKGAGALRLPRMAVNVAPEAKDWASAPPAVIPVGDAKVGVFGVIAADTLPGVPTTDPVPAGAAAIQKLRAEGAQVVVALVQASSKKDAVQLVRALPGVDVAVAGLGQNAPEPDRVEIAPSKVGDAWLVVPANRGQVISRIDVTLRPGGGALADAVGPGAAAAKRDSTAHELAVLDAELAKLATDPSADPAYVGAKHNERAQLAAEQAALAAHPLVVPAKGSYFTLEQVKVNKTLACSVPVQTAIAGYDRAAGEANVKAADATPVPAPAKGAASYVGMEACGDCHADAVEFWKKTVHHDAWKTLVERGQQFDLSCIGCHVTGWAQPGGSNLAHNDQLRDVQCETCHGPGSIHVAKGGEEKPAAVHRAPPEDLCFTQCHTREHSDTFERTAYLRDIVGPGHGADLRKQLGDGPTGHSLRTAALDKAGRTLGAGCTR